MIKLAALALVSVFAITATASTALAGCSRASVAGGDELILPEKKIDQAKFDAAVRAEVNYQRCRAGLAPLKASRGLRSVAATHAKWMASASNLSHASGVRGQNTVLARLKKSGVRFHAGSENIGLMARYRIDGVHFRIDTSSQCSFSNGGQSIPPHSYSSLANSIVSLWIVSPKHRKNILDPKVSMVGTGAGFDGSAQYCGRFYLSQSFAG